MRDSADNPWAGRMLLAVVLGSAACGSDALEPAGCNQTHACPFGHTCLGAECVQDGSLRKGATCTRPEQCGWGLTCRGFVCRPGCSKLYRREECADGTWCKPHTGPRRGECSPADCVPGIADGSCEHDHACIDLGAGIGACMRPCVYGFAGGLYFDNCVDIDGEDMACQALGVRLAPVCLPTPGEDGLTPGEVGCDLARAPCRPGAMCLDVVCRRLCYPDQEPTCATGERCQAAAVDTQVYFCRAD